MPPTTPGAPGAPSSSSLPSTGIVREGQPTGASPAAPVYTRAIEALPAIHILETQGVPVVQAWVHRAANLEPMVHVDWSATELEAQAARLRITIERAGRPGKVHTTYRFCGWQIVPKLDEEDIHDADTVSDESETVDLEVPSAAR